MEEVKRKVDSILGEVERIVGEEGDRDVKLDRICGVLSEAFPFFDWVGFYLVDPHRDRELVLGPFRGKPTEHVRIPFGRGICGQAAERGETFVVDDVSRETNYLSCSPEVKSEIVVPIFRGDRLVGELDIDSHTVSPWESEIVSFLEKVSAVVSRLF